MAGLFFLVFYLPSYGAIHGFSLTMIFYSISILNAASFVSHSLSSNDDSFILTFLKFGRILPGQLARSCFPSFVYLLLHIYILGLAADTWGRYNIMIIAGISSAVLTIASIAAKDTSSILVVGGAC